ncbi:MAG TPA: DedA family protein [Thermoguttaceae bacterium]|nr:DedA family protein [Thermoguttaceae bacterium]
MAHFFLLANVFSVHASYLGIFLFMVSTGAGMPLPEEVAIITAGYWASPEVAKLDPWPALGALLAGGLLGDCIMYWIGRHFGRAVVRRHRWWAHHMTTPREAKMEEMLDRHGLKVLFAARFMVGVRSPIYLSAGILRLPFRQFVICDLFAASIVISLFFWLSYFLGKPIAEQIVRIWELLVVIGVVVLVLVAIYYWRRHRRKKALANARPHEESSSEADNAEESASEVEHVA